MSNKFIFEKKGIRPLNEQGNPKVSGGFRNIFYRRQ